MKKQKAESHNETEYPALSPALYWEWRTTIAERFTSEQKLRNERLEAQIIKQNADMLIVKSQLHKATALRVAEENVKEAHLEYERMKEKIEKELGISLNGKMIDEFTYEVKDLPEELQTNK